LDGITPEQLIIGALTCEQDSAHPLARAIRERYAEVNKAPLSLMHQEYHGKGIKAQTSETTYYAGSRLFLHDMGVEKLPAEPEDTCIYVAEKERCLGYVTFRDEIRPNFGEVISSLRKAGIKKHIMLTGDHAFQAGKVAAELMLDDFRARLLPDEKLRELETIEQSRTAPVAFIGDGLNDAPVLSRAEIGIAMGAIGNQASIEAADVVLMQDEPGQLLGAVRMARKTRLVLWQNIWLALGIKAAVMVLGVGGHATLWEAVIADVGVTLLAVLNSTRLLRS
jgi:Cd2+/Zn2+-exporting ATPase